MNYFRTLIAVAEDCPAKSSVIPTERAGKTTVAVLQYRLLSRNARCLTQEDVLFDTWLQRQSLQEKPSKAHLAKLRTELFSKPQACLRSSPLPKKYGWGLLFDEKGRVSLCPMESAEYQRIVKEKPAEVKVLRALRSKRE